MKKDSWSTGGASSPMSAFATGWHEDEQAMEAEALEAILMDDVEIVSSTSPREYQVQCLPHPNGEGDNHVHAKLIFTIPATYPDVVPDVKVQNVKGLVTEQCEGLRDHIVEKAGENIGMAMIYTLVELAREWLIENNIDAGDGMHGAMLRRLHMKEMAKKKEDAVTAAASAKTTEEMEEEERNRQKVLDGTAVTPESFLIWKEKFDAELAALRLQKGLGPKAEAVDKPSGKEMFLRNLVSVLEGADIEEEEGVEVTGELFEGDDEDDSDFVLDSDEDDDEDEDDDDDEESEEEERPKKGGGGAVATGKKGGKKGR